MVDAVPPDAIALIPVPRALARRVAYGIDPSDQLAVELAAVTGIPVVHALQAPIWWPKRAGASRSRRGRVVFSSIGGEFDRAVLVDDVLTSGATMESAIDALGNPDISVITATAAGTMERGAVTHIGHGGGLRRSEE
jgi:predicted amidophosphoribosyltransferase